MKKFTHAFFMILACFMIFNFFIKNSAEADPVQSYEKYLSGQAIFIDIREESEVMEGMIKGAVWLPLSKINQNQSLEVTKIKELSKGKEIYIYCRSGSRASTFKSILQSEGISSINMGGFNQLVSAKLPTQKNPVSI